jgi:very-short-patch-repair endonuclease
MSRTVPTAPEAIIVQCSVRSCRYRALWFVDGRMSEGASMDGALPHERTDRVREQVKAWARELIDLTRRNRSLYYRPTKRTTLEIMSPSAAEVFSALLDDDSFTFFSPPPPVDGRPWSADEGIQAAGQNELVSTRTDEQDLDRTVKALARQAEQDLMDRGVQTLYAAFGMLEWRESGGDDGRVRSPLVYLPVSLSRASPRDPFIMQAASGEVLLNPSLVVKLETDFGIDLNTASDAASDASELRDVVGIVEGLVSERGWTVVETMILTRSTFHKESMYRDLLDNLEVISEHPLVRSLAGDTSAREAVAVSELPDEQEVDEFAPPEQARTILDADASQRRAIVAAQLGSSFVMDGPPGTGKSQTIANMIAELIAGGKKVLFVSEKAAALDVVASRLKDRGIDDFVLELHSHKASRKEVVQQLDRSLNHHVTAKTRLSRTDRSRAEARRHELTEYALAVNETREPLGRSVGWATGRLAQLAAVPALSAPSVVDRELDDAHFDSLMQRGQRLGRVWQPVTDDGFVWQGFSGEQLRLGEREQLLTGLDTAARASRQVQEVADELAYLIDLDAVENQAAAEHLLRVCDHLESQPGTPSAWWTRDATEPVASRLRELGATFDQLAEVDARLAERYPEVVAVAQTLSATTLDDLGRELSRVARAYTPDHVVASSRVRDVLSRLSALGETLDQIRQDTAYVYEAIGAPPAGHTLDRIRAIAAVASRSGETVRPEAGWLDPGIAGRVEQAVALLRPLQEQFAEQSQQLNETFNQEVLDLDLDTIRIRIERASGFQKLARPYREAKAELRPVSRSGRVDRSVRERVGEAATAKATRVQLDQQERIYKDVLGRYYDPRATDTDAVAQALELLSAVLGELQAIGQPEAVAAQFAGQGPEDRDLARIATRLLADIDDAAGCASELAPFGPKDPLHRSPETLLAWVSEIRPLTATLLELLEAVELVRTQPGAVTELVDELHDIERSAAMRQALSLAETDDRELLQDWYQGERTDVGAATEALSWVSELRALIGGAATARQIDRLYLSGSDLPDDGPLRKAIDASNKARSEVLDRFESDRRAELETTLRSDLDSEREALGELMDRIADVDVWCEHRLLVQELELAGLHGALEDARSARLAANDVAPALERAVLAAWVDDVISSDPRLSTVRSSERDALVAEYAELDLRIIADAAEQVIDTCNGTRPRTSLGGAATIQREAQKKRRHMPVRRLLQETVEVSTAIKPCFMMSPLSVSQFLPSDWKFDVVIFDEASQITPADAINCIYRGDQLVIAGDDRQLPPTSFFEASMDDDDGFEEDQFDQFESVLGLCKGSELLHALPLRWHYRSQHEDLITFSNYQFYDGQLITYPGAETARADLGVQLHIVDGVYRRGGRRDNPAEAEFLADRVLFHAREHPHLTVGVVALSSAQAETVEDIIDRRRAQHPELDEYFAADRLDGFFVKNLENVQGDERDIILLSIGYGPDEAGKFTMNFGPINREGGERRLNVAITRARRRVEVVASFTPEQMRPGDSKSRGLHELQRYLEYLRSGHAALAIDLTGSMGDVESPFEEEVMRTVAGWGYEVVPQVGTAGYRVDLGVRDPKNPGRYTLGIECDGAAYHSTRVARDRDRLRQQVLEGLGWTLHRVWGPSWYRHRAQSETELRDAIDAALAGRNRQPSRPASRSETTRDVETIDLSARPLWTSYYELAPVNPTTRDRADSPRGLEELHELVGRIVRIESPVHREVVARRIANAFKHTLTRRTQTAVDAAISSLASRGAVEERGVIIWSGTDVRVRVPREGDDRTRRDAKHIPPAETEAAVLHLLRDAHAAERAELLDAVKGLFGWARMGPQIAAALEAALDALMQAGLVDETADGRLRAIDS